MNRPSRVRTAVFVLVPMIAFFALLEGTARLLLDSEAVRTWFVRDGNLVHTLASVHEAMYREPFRSTFDPYNGYRLADPDRPQSNRPPRVPGPPKRPGEIRIVCMGDSTTFGLHLKEEDAWPARLQAHLNAQAPAGTHFLVFNGGVPAYGPQQCKRLLQSRYLRLQPDIVLWREELDLDDRLELPEVMPERWNRIQQALLRSRFLYLAVNWRMMRAYERGTDARQPGWHLFNMPGRTGADYRKDILPEFAEWLKARGVRELIGVEYLFYTGSEFGEVLRPYYDAELAEGLTVVGNGPEWERHGLPYVSFRDRAAEYPGGPDALFVDFCHFTKEGADWIGGVIAEELRIRWPELTVPESMEGM